MKLKPKTHEEEFIEEIEKQTFQVLCAIIISGKNKYILPIGYTKTDMASFLSKIRNISKGYPGITDESYIWYLDGSWSERAEYDYLDFWAHRKFPPFPKEIIFNENI